MTTSTLQLNNKISYINTLINKKYTIILCKENATYQLNIIKTNDETRYLKRLATGTKNELWWTLQTVENLTPYFKTGGKE